MNPDEADTPRAANDSCPPDLSQPKRVEEETIDVEEETKASNKTATPEEEPAWLRAASQLMEGGVQDRQEPIASSIPDMRKMPQQLQPQPCTAADEPVASYTNSYCDTFAQLVSRLRSVLCDIRWSQVTVFVLLVLVLGVGIESRSRLSAAITMCSSDSSTGSLNQCDSQVTLQRERDDMQAKYQVLKESDDRCKRGAHAIQSDLTAVSQELAESVRAHASCVSEAEDALQRSDAALSETRHELQEAREQLSNAQAETKRTTGTVQELTAKLEAERIRCQASSIKAPAVSERAGAQLRQLHALRAELQGLKGVQQKSDARVSSLKEALAHAQRNAEEVERARKVEREGWRWRLLHEANGQVKPADQRATIVKQRETIHLLSETVREQEREVAKLEQKLQRRAARQEVPRGSASGRGWPSSWWGDFGTDADRLFGQCPFRKGAL